MAGKDKKCNFISKNTGHLKHRATKFCEEGEKIPGLLLASSLELPTVNKVNTLIIKSDNFVHS